jgi:threonine/homoserine/homoserine lactone efflux protein
MSPAFADQFFALVVFAITSFFTPGPNNVMLLTSGVNHGFRRTVPHMAGVTIGYAVMTVLVAIGLGSVFHAHPRIHDVVEAIGVAYLLYLAYRIATAPVDRGIDTAGAATAARPFTFLQAAAFQWVNAKGWVMVVSVASIWVPEGEGAAVWIALIFVVFLLTGVGSTVTWAALGAGIARFMRAPWRLRLFNVTMAVLLVASLWPAFVDLARVLGEVRG